MISVLILGAQSPLAECAVQHFLSTTDASLTLLRKRGKGFVGSSAERVRAIEGTSVDAVAIDRAMRGHDVVLANPEGDLTSLATGIVRAMNDAGVRRLIYISWVGLLSELTVERHRDVIEPHMNAETIIEESDLDYTILRPAWLTDKNEINYVTTPKGEPFRGTTVSRKSVSALAVDLISAPCHPSASRNLSVSKAD